MAVIQTNLRCELQEAVKVQYLNGVLFSQDNQANQINVAVYENGEPASIAGNVTANVIRSDGGTVAVSGGTISENVASILLPSAAYYIPGVISIIIKITDDSVITTIAAVVANVYRSSTDTAVDPGTIIPSIQTLISSIETAVASIPADYSSLWTSLAPAFSSSTAYAAGQYVTYDGKMYRFTADHAASSWVAGDVVQINIGDDMFQLKKNTENCIPDAIKAAAGFRVATFVSGYQSTAAVGDTSSGLISSTNYVSAKFPVTSTDYVELCGDGGSSYQRLYAILDADNKVLFREVASKSGVVKPDMSQYPTAAYIVVNSRKTYANTYLFVGPSVKNRLTELDESLEALSDAMVHEFDGFVQKNVKSTNGKLDDSTESITNNELIAIGNIFKATSNYSNILVFMYDSSQSYIGNSANQTKLIDTQKLNDLKESNPTAAYVRVRFGNSTHPVTLENYQENGVSLLLYNVETNEDLLGHVTFDDISAYGTDGVFTPSGEDPLTFTVKIPFNGDKRNQIFTCIAKYSQGEGVTDVPTVKFYNAGSTSNLNRTTEYIIGGKDNYETKQWRVIRYPGSSGYAAAVFTIPAGVTCTIKDFYNEYSDRISRNANGIRFNSHRKFPTTPDDTMPGVEMAVKSGACAMIEIPKRLSDGVWIFYHDDSLVYNDTYIRQADGTQLPSTYNGTLWSAISSETAFGWDWGVSTSSRFAGLKPMQMEEFFRTCAKTGILPMLSVHPWPSSSELAEIKAIAKKCGVLNMLGIKTTTAHIAEAYSVFGNDIESYTIDVSSGSQTASVINAAISAMDGLTGCTVRRVIELFASTAYYAYCGESTYDAYKLISDAGYGCAIAQQSGSYHPTLPNANSVLFKATDIEYWMKKGVTEFTYEYNWSFGLYW